MKKALFVLLVMLFALAIFLRFYQLGSIPLGLNKDETAIGYNAYSILQTGHDEHGASYPLYFKSYNDYKLPVYIYLTAASEKVFGITPTAVRLPSAVFGIITIIALFFLIKTVSKRLDLAIVSSLFLAFNPWQFFFSRTGFEVNVATCFAVLGSLFFVLAMQKKGKLWYLLLAIGMFGVSIYSYNVARLMAPLLFITLTVLYRHKIHTWSRRQLIFSALVSLLVLLPLLMTLWTNSGLNNQTAGVFLNGIQTTVQNLEFRSYLVSLPEIFTKLFFNSNALLLWEYIRNLIRSFSTDFFFILGPGSVNGMASYGVFYPFELITIVLGMYLGIKKKVLYLNYFFIWLALTILLVALTQEVPHATRSFMEVIPLTIFSSFGALALWKYIMQVRRPVLQRSLQIVVLGVMVYAATSYFTSYFFVFPTHQAKIWHGVDAELIAFLDANEHKYDKIIIDPRADISYTAVAFYKQYPPARYHKEAVYKRDGLLISAEKLGKYTFATIDWETFAGARNTLYITTFDSYDNKPVYKIFHYKERPVVEAVDGVLTSYPFKDPAYVAIESRRK